MARLASISRTMRPQIGTAIVAVLNHPSVDWPPWLIGCTGPRKGRWSPTSTVNNKNVVRYIPAFVRKLNYAKRFIIYKFTQPSTFAIVLNHWFETLHNCLFRFLSLYISTCITRRSSTEFKEIDITRIIKLKGRRTKLCYSLNIDAKRGERELKRIKKKIRCKINVEMRAKIAL